MGIIQVTAGQLRQEAERMGQLNNQFKNQILLLEAKEQNLGTMWEGQAKDTFRGAFLRDKGHMEEFCQLIGRYTQALHQIAAKYEQAERKNMEIAASRNY